MIDATIRDTSLLIEARRAIEHQMVRAPFYSTLTCCPELRRLVNACIAALLDSAMVKMASSDEAFLTIVPLYPCCTPVRESLTGVQTKIHSS